MDSTLTASRRWVGWLVLGALMAALAVFLAIPALGVADVPFTSAPEPALATAATAAPSPSIGELLGGALKVVQDYPTLGWMGLVAAVCALLAKVTRLPFLDKFFMMAPGWVRPAITVGVGAIGGFFSGLPAGLGSAVAAAIAGVGAGFAGEGANLAGGKLTTSGAAERAVVNAVKEVVRASDSEVAAKRAAVEALLSKAAGAPPGLPRLEAIAAAAGRKRRTT